MKKSRLFMATGAVVLAISAVFATKANKKLTNSVKTGFFHNGIAIKTAVNGNIDWLTTYGGTGHGAKALVTIYTATNSKLVFYTQLRTSPTSSKVLYLL